MFFLSQTWDADKKIKSLVDELFICRNIASVFVALRRVEKRITIKDSSADADSQIVDEVRFVPLLVPGSTKVISIDKYTDCFNSYDPPKLPEFPKKYSISS